MTTDVQYTIAQMGNSRTVHVIFDGEPFTFGPAHPYVADAHAAIQDYAGGRLAEAELETTIRSLANPGVAINAALREVSTRFSYIDDTLRFDGDVIDKTLTRVIVERVKAGDDQWVAYARFMQHLANNPSRESRNALYRWVADRNLTITDAGMIVGYKGLTSEKTSVRSGAGIVHRMVDGKLETQTFTHSRLPNESGSWVEFPRAEVDPNRAASCSVGLHVGTRAFAENFAGEDGYVATVLVDPSAVVMVPDDAEGQKMRVWQYYVTELDPVVVSKKTTLNYSIAFNPYVEDDEEWEGDWEDQDQEGDSWDFEPPLDEEEEEEHGYAPGHTHLNDKASRAQRLRELAEVHLNRR